MGGGGSDSKYIIRYYKTAEDAPEDVTSVLTCSSTVKLIIRSEVGIYPTIQGYNIISNDKKYIGFSFTPFYGELNNSNQFIYTLDEFLIVMANGNEEVINSFKQYFTEITEDEYYNIN